MGGVRVAGWAAMALNSLPAVLDPDTRHRVIHSASAATCPRSSSNTRITIAEAGWYTVGAALGWSASNSNRRTFWSYYKNGAITGMVNVQVGPSTNGYGSSVFEMPILLAAADYLQMGLFQDGTGASATLQNPAFFWAYRMPW
jgi:hypothetical protein